MARRPSTLLKANDYDSEEPVHTEELDDEEGYDEEPETVKNPGSNSINKSIAQIAKGQRDLALSMSMIAKALTTRTLTKHDPMGGVGDEDEGYDDDEDYDDDEPEGAHDHEMSDGSHTHNQQMDPGEENLSLANGGYGRLRGAGRARISKDNDSTTFGEIDDDEPGNRPFDQANTKESDTVITGRPGSGPGPMSGSLRKAIAADILKDLESQGRLLPASTVSKSATTPDPGASTAQDYTASSINKAIEETTDLVAQYAKLSWHDLNRARFEMVPGSVLPFPIFGQPYGG